MIDALTVWPVLIGSCLNLKDVRDEYRLHSSDRGIKCAHEADDEDGNGFVQAGHGLQGQGRSVDHDAHVKRRLDDESHTGHQTSHFAEPQFQVLGNR